ncbi:uncharacterized protein ARMOST_22081 [Armillaria ostoyae]|uniref:Uncharacterized protein n=1 Tax=Armillaria ostoyae TaxID=47428 RepID=A0A284SBW9_ARMOS|nr:uncharacterized protein ARMOST_22081 [Armillaria ostoyae]
MSAHRSSIILQETLVPSHPFHVGFRVCSAAKFSQGSQDSRCFFINGDIASIDKEKASEIIKSRLPLRADLDEKIDGAYMRLYIIV